MFPCYFRIAMRTFRKAVTILHPQCIVQKKQFMSISYLMPLTSTDPMLPVLSLAAIQVGMGGFDNLYHHEVTERLPWRVSQIDEQLLHAVRGALYTGVFASFAGVTPHGTLAYAMAGILVTEMGITLMDFVTEDRTRLISATERVTHTLMTLNYGAMLACWLPILINDWGSLPTDVVFHNYGILSAFNALCAAGVAGWSVRDYFAAKRLRVFAKESLPLLNLSTPGQRFLITGGTGLLGSRLIHCLLEEKHDVTVIARDPVKAARILSLSSVNERGASQKDTSKTRFGKLTLVTALADFPSPSQEKFDVVVNLAGAPIADMKWTDARKSDLWRSRVDLTQALCAFINQLEYKPKVFLQGSAVGYYGVDYSNSAAPIDERSEPIETNSFSHQLVQAWEGATEILECPGIRMVYLRTGVVLSREGGAMAKMLFPFEFCVGGRTGSGQQVMSWIHIDDWIRGVGACIDNKMLTGPVNLTAPQAHTSTNMSFAKALGRALHRPAVVPLPGGALKIVLGEELVNELLLGSTPVRPKRLEQMGFQFQYPDVDSALHAICSGATPFKENLNKKSE